MVFFILPYPISWWIWQFERGTLSTQKKTTLIFFTAVCMAVTREAVQGLHGRQHYCFLSHSLLGKSSSCWASQTSCTQGSGYPTRGMAALHPAQGKEEINAVMFCLVPWDKVAAIICHLYWDKRRLHPLDATLTFLSFPLFQQLIILPKMGSTLQLLLSHFSLFPC